MITPHEKILTFIKEHHVLNLCVAAHDEVYAASCFYVFEQEEVVLVFASDELTKHMQMIKINENVAGTIVLETKEVGLIQGLQLTGKVIKAKEKKYKKLYLKQYPYALAMNPTLWILELEFMKLTNNRLGFGKKLLWKRDEM